MKKILIALSILALAGSEAFAADKIHKGDQFVVAAVNFLQPFRTPSGQILKAGLYDLKVVSDGTEGVLIGLLKGGKQVGQLRGTVMQGGKPFCGGCDAPPQASGSPGKALPVDQGVKIQPVGSPGKALPVDQGVKLQPGVVAGPIHPPGDPKTFRDLGFTSSSRVSFGGGAGKISCSNNLYPTAILPFIEFPVVPAVPKTK